MKVDIISSDNPYKLDKTKYKEEVALTRKNADFIEAVVELDSNYKNDSDINNKKTAAYGFNQMLIEPNNYETYLKNCIDEIDRTNSTHLESTIDGREKMFNIIKKHCPTPRDLRKAVKVNPSKENRNNLFYELCVTMDNHKGDKANNLSFASKFISYARKFLNNNDTSFSKYDKVVSRKLSLYENIYVDRSIKVVASKYENKSSDRRQLNDLEKQIYTYEKYLEYMEAIDSILIHLKKDNGIEINKEEFDHIIWYSSKGK